ncbi:MULTISPECIES: TetR/AcrR family transcriptional regulator [unclassified Apibacter]|uniref:TetR/AcrR family transcriptional regulator n=1 Tax=unclassified Apibacter TaxID=2630820 RepID=UPI00132944FD|nr:MULTISPECIES: TetR/AcrR family transcriptional regulator [unclassified Apibacter]MCX8676915.1 TetR/AcrR family transcriptional regulator [Apibacter sp. B3919]MXO24703.1 TetR family transcriptional regulator [Apibacter sp. B3924]MXO25947.1 TetR family transcriptional regulator [Apibacter sp. B3813]MXO27898.1 TetR family transcriptional regulator [Apibacter sp. B3913]MXO29742.1 TetR family transcriptional regulator [Apibacter sp. B3912]
MVRDVSTEQKIKEAAKRVFQKKGFGLTRTRDIAKEAGINLALLNYYYRSKENLFEIVMQESIEEMFFYLEHIMNNKQTTLTEKIDAGVLRYIEGMSKNSNLPLFLFSELQANPQHLFDRVKIPEGFIQETYMFKQINEQINKEKLNFTAIHFFINLVSMSIFPIIGQPFIKYVTKMDEKSFTDFIEQRKTLVPIWLKSMLKLV